MSGIDSPDGNQLGRKQSIDQHSSSIGRPRLILVDDNIRDQSGHYFELASLLLDGAEHLGYECVLGTNHDFQSATIAGRPWRVHRVFETRRLVRWSLGVDGASRCERDLHGNPVESRPIKKMLFGFTDWLGPVRKRPNHMLQKWSDGLCALLKEIRPTKSDCLLINTGDDFALLALGNAMRRLQMPPLRIDVLFHFALYESGQKDQALRMRLLSQQIRSAIEALQPHSVHLHTTTDALANQMRELEGGGPIGSIPYLTRSCTLASGSGKDRLRAVIAGMPRAEKGKNEIAQVLTGLEEQLIRSGQYQLSMQVPRERWKSMVPTSLHRHSEICMPGESVQPLELVTSTLTTKEYHRWLNTADLGLFLYEPKRYEARCSGVLLEMLARGVPVIVPDNCWLASQVRLAGGHRSIGYIYQDRREIPDLMQQFQRAREEIVARTRAHAAKIASTHEGRNTLLEMGMEAPSQHKTAA